ncbi:MAG TPA: NAD(P)-dependent oxidoreductase, partial [Pseudomonadales bacterium]|nr:NAD(P)-dependent oxidoreductase [Pseudomonadales bacterium]
MDYFPIFLRVQGRDCLLVGGGEIALRKATALARAGAVLHVVAPDIRDDLAALVTASGGSLSRREFTADD